jgi:hypothetical protein
MKNNSPSTESHTQKSAPRVGTRSDRRLFGFTMSPALYFLLACLTLTTILPAGTHQLNKAEMKLFKLVAADASQKRATLNLDPILCKVARARAADMVQRNYFSHVNPDGKGANYFIRRKGYILPDSYDASASANNVESIGQSTGTPASVLSLWKNSEFHRLHLMGESPFYRAQKSIGIGIVRSPKAPYYKYFVFISAPPNLSKNPPLWILKNPSGKVIATTQTAAGT